MRTFLTLLALCLVAACDTAEPTLSPPPPNPIPPAAFEALFGTERYDAGHDLLPLADGDLLVAGAGNGGVAPADGNLPFPLLSRLGARGTVRWTRIYESLGFGEALGIAEASPGRFGLLLDLHDDSFQQRRLALWEVDAEGQLLRPLFEYSGATVPYTATRPLLALADGGFLLLGTDRADDAPAYEFVTRLDAEGQVRWGHSFAQARLNLVAALPVADDGFILVGNQVVSTQPFLQKLFVARVGEGGAIRWQKLLDMPEGFIEATAVTEVNGGFTVAGRMQTGADSASVVLPFFALLSEDGDVLRAAPLALDIAPQALFTRAMVTVPGGGGLALTGWLNETHAARTEAFVLLFTSDGMVHWFDRLGAEGTITLGYDIAAPGPDTITLTGSRGPDIPTYGGADFDVLVRQYTVGLLR